MAQGSSSRVGVRCNGQERSPHSRSAMQTSTRLATKRQAKLPFKKSGLLAQPSRKGVVDTAKLMYRSNVSGVIKTVQELQFGAGHIKQLKKTPFWLMIDAIRVHNLDPKAFMKCDATVCRIIQTYNPVDEKFYVGGKGLPLRNSDVRLIFGIQCGKDKLNLTHSGKPPSDFIQRRCPNVNRLSAKVIKDLLMVAIQGSTERDEEDVAKLMCLYICGKLFFAMAGESIGWAFVRVIDKLETLRQYDWTATIRNALIGSLNETHGRPEKVTGCVVALLFLLCEHTSIVEPDRREVSPRFCRWNIGKFVGKLKGVELSIAGSIEVNTDKLNGTIIERYFVKVLDDATVTDDKGVHVIQVQPVSTWDGGVGNVVTDAVNVREPSLDCWKPDSPNGGEVKFTSKMKEEYITAAQTCGRKKLDGKMIAAGGEWLGENDSSWEGIL